MTRLRVDGKPKRGDPLYGYAKYLPSEYNESHGRAMTSWCIYEVPDDVAAEMLAKGAKVDK